MKVKDEDAGNFYLEGVVIAGWSSGQLDRQINSFYYKRILAGKDKEKMINRNKLYFMEGKL